MIDLQIISKQKYNEIKKQKQLKIHYGFHKSPFGLCLIGILDDRICHLTFVKRVSSTPIKLLQTQWPGALLEEDKDLTGRVAEEVFEEKSDSFKVILIGTPFEGQVWQALLKIPKGETVSYQDVAKMTGNEKAVRAAANAVAKNFVSYLIPCHRVIKKDGSLHKYGGGANVKKKILEYESCYTRYF